MVLTQPEARGEVRLASSDPSRAPLIRQHFLGPEHDRKVLREGFEIARSLAASSEMAPFIRTEISPGPDCATQDAIDAHVRKTLITVHHPAGTCRMGSQNDTAAVVGSDLRVHGTEALRVVDASVMPDLPNGNINAAVIMIAERAADMILGAATGPPGDCEGRGGSLKERVGRLPAPIAQAEWNRNRLWRSRRQTRPFQKHFS